MSYLSATKLKRTYGERTLFSDLEFYISKGQKVALIAQNGTGKTSLLRILAGVEPPEAGGDVKVHPGLKVGYLPQEPDLPGDFSMIDCALDLDDPIAKAVRHYESMLFLEKSGDELHDAMQEMDRLQAWDFEGRTKQILGKLNLTDYGQLVSTLSGGQRKRLALARLLVSQPDLMILDEPTNHLDLEMIEWLESHLSKQNITLLMVTHDRYFLDRVCSEILELDEGELHKYKGNYTYFLEKKEERTDSRNKNVEKARNIYRKELDWVNRMPKARGTKQKARLDSFEVIKAEARKKIKEDPMRIDIQMTRLGSKIIEIHKAHKSYGDKKILSGFSYKFQQRERVGIVGANGTGKTTLLNLICGLEQVDAGKIVHGSTLDIGYYSQEGLKLEKDKRVIDVVRDIAEYIPMWGGQKMYAATLLERFLFDRAQQQQYASTLSGGERRRLYLLTILMGNPNFLILDEPTNDLDIMTLNILEDFLIQYEGCLAVVSHDRFFMDKMVDHLFVFGEQGEVRDFPGNYTQYRLARDAEKIESRAASAERPAEKSAAAVAQANRKRQTKNKLSFKEKREFESLEGEIEKLEARKVEIEKLFSGAGLPHKEMTKLTKELASVIADIDTKGNRWLELSEYA